MILKAAIEACLLHGLKRSGLLFKTSTTITLLQKLCKSCNEAKLILQMCDDYDKAYCSKTSKNQSLKPNLGNKRKELNSQNSNQQPSPIFRRLFSNPEVPLSPQLMNGRSFSPTYYKVTFRG